MASFTSSPRSQLLGGARLLLTVIAFTAVVIDSARATSAAAPTIAPNNKPRIKQVYPSCSTTLMPNKCSATLSALSKSLAEARAEMSMAGRKEFKSEPCVSECIKVLDAAAPNVAAAEAGGEDALLRLKEYLDQLFVFNEGPIGPCDCHCQNVHCSMAEEAVVVKQMQDASDAMLALVNLCQTLYDDLDDEEKEKLALEDKSMD